LSNISNFATLGDQLQAIIVRLLEDQELVDLIANEVGADPYSLIDTKIYPDYYRPPNETEAVIVCVFFNRFQKRNNNTKFKYGKLNINISYHRNLLKTPDGKLRHYEIMHRIDTILNSNSVSGSVSDDNFDDAVYYPVNEFFNSFTLTYTNWNL
jgi:hypothetical protein